MSRQVRIDDEAVELIEGYRAAQAEADRELSFAQATTEVITWALEADTTDDDTDDEPEPVVSQPRQTAARIGRTHRRIGRRIRP